MNTVFGGQFSSRLNMNLREEKGFTYGARSHFDWRVRHPGRSWPRPAFRPRSRTWRSSSSSRS